MTDFVTEPMVKLVSRPVIDIDGLTTFLDAHNISWPDFQKKLDSNLDLGIVQGFEVHNPYLQMHEQ